MKTKTRILHVDDNLHDRQLIKDALLKEHDGFEVIEADSRQKFEQYLSENDFDLVLSDFNIPGFDGLQVLQIVKEKCPEIPVIIVTGTGSEEIAVQAMKLGADDYVIKSVKHIRGLVPAIKTVLKNKKIQDEHKKKLIALRESDELFRLLFDNSMDAVLLTIPDGTILKANPAACNIFGRTEEEIIQVGRNGIIDKTDPRLSLALEERLRTGLFKGELTGLRNDGATFPIEMSSALFQDSDGNKRTSMIVRNITKRKQIEEALSASETSYRRLFESAKDGILILDAESGKIVDVNPFLVELLGYPKEQVLEKKIWEIGIFKDIIANRNNFLELQKKEYIRYNDLPLETANGQNIDVEFVSNVYSVNHHKVIQCNIRNNTERKIADENIQFQYAMLSTQQEASIDGILVVNEQGEMISYNQQFIRMWNIPDDIIESKSDERALQSVMGSLANPEEFINKVNFLYEHKKDISRDEIKLKDGRTFDRYSAPMFGKNSKYYGRVWYFRDLTERKNAEEIIIKERILLKTLIDNLPSAVFVKDKEFRKVVANTLHLSSIVGHLSSLGMDSKVDVIGKTDFEVYPNELAEKYFADDQKVIRDGYLQINKEEEGVSPEGKQIWLLVSKIPVRDENGVINAMVGITTDISEIKQAEEELIRKKAEIEKQNVKYLALNNEYLSVNEELRTINVELSEARDKAEESDRLKTAFLQNMSHEIRTPMNGVLGFAELLKNPKLPELKQQEFIRLIEQSGQRMLNIINDIMNISKIETGQIELENTGN